MDGDHCSEQPAVYIDNIYPWSFPKETPYNHHPTHHSYTHTCDLQDEVQL